MKRLIALVITLAAVVTLYGSPQVQAQVTGVRNCDNNAVIRCGALDQAELKSRYAANTTGDLPAIFSYYGISTADINGEMKMGRVTKQGNVEVNGKVVATNSRSLGRSPINGSSPVTINGKRYYETPDTLSLRSASVDALVIMKNGQFYAAIMTACANPVKATPVQQPPEPVKPQAVYSCDTLTATPLDQARTQYRFTIAASVANGAKIVNYNYGFGDGYGVESSQNSYEYTYRQPGTYTATAVVNVMVDGQTAKVTSRQCEVKVTVPAPVQQEEVKPEPCQISGKETLPKNSPDCKEVVQAQPVAALPSTGPGQLLGAGMGAGSLTAAGYYFIRSRRSLLHAMLKK